VVRDTRKASRQILLEYDADFDLIVFFFVYGTEAHESDEKEWADKNLIEEQSGIHVSFVFACYLILPSDRPGLCFLCSSLQSD